MFVSLYITYHLIKRIRPNLVLAFAAALIFISVMGFIKLTRTYQRGIVVTEKVKSLDTEVFFLEGFGESEVFQSSGLILSRIPDYYPHLGSQFLIETLAIPVPRAFWKEKPSGESLDAIHSVYEIEANVVGAGVGAAIFNFAEAYVAYGWKGLIIVSFIWGLIFAKVWRLFLANKYNPIAIVLIATFNAFIYVVISRGYLPQIAFQFFFTVFPVLWVWRRTNKNKYAYSQSG
jgi:hypothetical protein